MDSPQRGRKERAKARIPKSPCGPRETSGARIARKAGILNVCEPCRDQHRVGRALEEQPREARPSNRQQVR